MRGHHHAGIAVGMDPLLIAAGAVTGFVVGVTGVGGGALMTPILLLLFGVAPTVAVGTDLWFAAITKLFATRVHYSRGLIDWQIARRLWAGSLPASCLTMVFVWQGWLQKEGFLPLQSVIAGAVILTAIGMLLQQPLHRLGRHFRITGEATFKAWQGPLTVGCGAALGVLVTLTSVGAGALGAVFLVYLYPLRLTPPRLIATDIIHAIPLAAFAGFGHLAMGNVSLGLLGNLLLGSVPAVIAGVAISARLPHAMLRACLALVLLLVGLKLGWSSAK